ncbi:MAG: MBL fold metallo-hydrolase [Actinobacteria bacterium]|nr:MBL fold metallo-hydrolase [Actinomycetota bacterium]
MDVITLGTGSPLPTPDRAGPSTLVRAGGRDLLFDCGRGVLLRAAAVGSGALNFATVYLTHLHSDHVTDFNDLVTTRWAMSPFENPLKVVGPVGTQQFVDRTLAMLETDIGYRLDHHDDLCWNPPVEVTETDAAVDGTVISDVGGVRVIAAPTDHAPVQPTLGYRVEADGASVVIAGDTVPCEGLFTLCQGADVYVQTVIRPSLIKMIPSARLQDVVDYHSSIEDAAATATKAGVRQLVLTHPVPPPPPGTEHEWVDEARRAFDGDVVLASDLDTVTVPATT